MRRTVLALVVMGCQMAHAPARTPVVIPEPETPAAPVSTSIPTPPQPPVEPLSGSGEAPPPVTPPTQPPAAQARAGTPAEPVEFRTPPLKEKLLDFLPADLNGDGGSELVLLGARFLAVWRYEGKGFVELSRVRFKRFYPPRVTAGRLLARDTDGDGAAEVFISLSSARQGGVFRWQGGALVKVAPLTAAPVAFNEAGDLLSAPWRGPFALSPKVQWQQTTTGKVLSQPAPPLEDFFDMELARTGGVDLYVSTDTAYKLKARTTTGFKAVLAAPGGLGLAVAQGQTPGHLLAFTSLGTLLENNDGVRAVYFDRRALTPVWQSKPLGGRVSKLRLADYDQDGALELLALVEKGVFPFFETSLVALDVSKVPALATRGAWRP